MQVKVSKTKKFFVSKFGNKEFIKICAKLFFPAIIEIIILSSVNYLDSLFLALFTPDNMGAAAKTATVIASQLTFMPLIIFMAIAAMAGIYGSQYYGKGDMKSFKETINFSLLFGFGVVLVFVVIYTSVPDKMVELFSGNEIKADAVNEIDQNIYKQTNLLAASYLRFQSLTMFPYVVSFVLANAYRQDSKTIIPLVSSIIGVCVNVILDPILIKYASINAFEAVNNVAFATIAARGIDALFLIIITLTRKQAPYYFFDHLKLKNQLIRNIFAKGWTILINEIVFSVGLTIMLMFINIYNQSHRDSIATLTIVAQFTNLLWPGSATVVGVLVIAKLGNNEMETAQDNTNKIINWSIVVGVVLALIVVICSFFINELLNPSTNLEDQIANAKAAKTAEIAKYLEWILAFVVFVQSPYSIFYFCIRGGGSRWVIILDTLTTLLWLIFIGTLTNVNVPTDETKRLHVVLVIFLFELQMPFKLMLAYILYKKTKWKNNLVSDQLNNVELLTKEG